MAVYYPHNKGGTIVFSRNVRLKEYVSDNDYEEAMKNASLSSLGTWYAELLDKHLSELSNFDIIRCIRQKVFIEEVIQECMERMSTQGTLLYSDDDCIELVEKIASVDTTILSQYKNQLEVIFDNMNSQNLIDKYEIWLYEEEKDEFKESMNRIKKKIGI